MEWIAKESDNYIFNYYSGSVGEKEMEKIMNMQETCYDFISMFGMHKFKTFYSSLNEDNFQSSFLEIFKMPMSVADAKFIRYVDSIGSNDAIFNIIRNELENRKLL